MQNLLSPHTVVGGVWRLFVMAAIILGLFLGVMYISLRQVTLIESEIRHTEAVENELRDLGEDMINAETGQRGYLVTEDIAYLEPYNAGVASVHRHLANLHQLVVNPQTRDKLERMVVMIDLKLGELRHTIALNQQGRRDEALNLVRTNSGKQFMDQFRQLRGAAIGIEQDLMREHRTRLLEQFRNIFLIVVLGGLIALLLLFLSALETAKRLKQPLQEVIDGIHAMAKGDLEHQVKITSQDEIAQIGVAFNHMAAKELAARRELEMTERELKRSNTELDNFAYVASHDLKAPLRGIRSLTQWIAEDVEETASEETLDNLGLLSRRVDRLDSLLESLLAYSRIGRKNAAPEPVDIGKLLADIRDYLAPGAGFQITFAEALPTILTFKAPLELVLRNLINNALKHHDGKSGLVSVSIVETGDQVEFRVADDGPGIPPEFHDRIFQMFQTLKPRDEVEGSGMGLAMVKKTVEGLGGAVRVESTPSVRGSTFIFTWPKPA